MINLGLEHFPESRLNMACQVLLAQMQNLHSRRFDVFDIPLTFFFVSLKGQRSYHFRCSEFSVFEFIQNSANALSALGLEAASLYAESPLLGIYLVAPFWVGEWIEDGEKGVLMSMMLPSPEELGGGEKVSQALVCVGLTCDRRVAACAVEVLEYKDKIIYDSVRILPSEIISQEVLSELFRSYEYYVSIGK